MHMRVSMMHDEVRNAGCWGQGACSGAHPVLQGRVPDGEAGAVRREGQVGGVLRDAKIGFQSGHRAHILKLARACML